MIMSLSDLIRQSLNASIAKKGGTQCPWITSQLILKLPTMQFYTTAKHIALSMKTNQTKHAVQNQPFFLAEADFTLNWTARLGCWEKVEKSAVWDYNICRRIIWQATESKYNIYRGTLRSYGNRRKQQIFSIEFCTGINAEIWQ